MVVLIVFYPLQVIAFLSPLFRSTSKQKGDMLAVSHSPKIKIEFNVTDNEKSKLIKRMKEFVETITNDSDAIDIMVNDEIEDEPNVPYVPDEDQEMPDLEIDDPNGPDVTEDDAPDDDLPSGSDYIRLGDI